MKLTDKNRLSLTHPELCKEWDYEKNGDLKPENVSDGSSKIVWWKCKNGHEWEELVSNRTNTTKNNTICHSCRSLAFRYPDLISEWDYFRNKRNPKEISFASHEKVWWKCKNGHEWEFSVKGRTLRQNKCSACNSLYFKSPLLLKEWHPTKNGNLKPINIDYNSNVKVWWKCSHKGHEWKVSPNDRNNKKHARNCPYCSGRKVCKDNCLITKNPDIAKEWHPTKNGSLTAYNVTSCSSKKVWWKCKKCNKEWVSNINNRTSGQNGCPYCNKIELKDGFICDSLLEAYYYLKLKSRHIGFIHNKRYPGINKNRFDFYIPKLKTYVEVTSFNFGTNKLFGDGFWFSYLRKIVKKKQYVENVLCENFRFIHKKLNKNQVKFIRENRK